MRAAVLVATLIAGMLPSSARAQATGARRTSRKPVLGGGTCTVLDVRLTFPDSLRATVPSKGCGPAELVVVGQPKLTFEGKGRYSGWRRLSIRVAVRNVGSARLSSPIELRTDSVTPVYRGVQFPQNMMAAFVSHPTIWPQYYSSPRAVFGAHGGSTGGLAPGERSRSFELTFTPLPQTDHFRVWVDLRRAGVQRPDPLQSIPHPPADGKPLGAEVDAFIARARLPLEREREALFRMPERDLLIFFTSFGTAQDCLGGCFYSRALGLKYGPRIGWIDVKHYDSDTLQRVRWKSSALILSSGDGYLQSVAFLDTVRAVFGKYGYVSTSLIELLLSSPQLPRATLRQLVVRLNDEADGYLAERLVQHPMVKRDPELLLMLASLPTIDRVYLDTRRHARDALMAHAAALIADPATSARTLFLLATCVPIYSYPADSLMARLARHPNARDNLAIQLVTQPSRGVAMVRASPRVRAALDQYLEREDGRADRTVLAAELLADPEAGHNLDVLLVLANRGDDIVAWEATRRLPPTALSRLAEYYLPRPWAGAR